MARKIRRRSPGPPQLGDAEYRALGRFRRTMREFLAFSEGSAREQGLTPQQHQALLAIRAHPEPQGMSIGELADSLLIRNHTAVELVGRLVERGLVARGDDPDDRRKVRVRLEPLGAGFLERISSRNLQQLSETAHILSELLETCRHLQSEGEGGLPEAPGPVAAQPAK